MKKIITAVTALIAMSVAFMSCGFTDGAAEPQLDYQTVNVDLEEYSNTDLGWYPTFEMVGSDFAALKGVDNPKITFVVEKDEGAEYYQVGLQYGNGSVGSWGSYDGKIYDKEGNVISVNNEGIFQNISTFVLKPEAKQIESLLDRGLVVQGDKATLTSVTIEYVGDKGINTTIRNMAKADGTFGGKGEVLLDPDNANITVWTIESKEENVDATYKFTGAADLSKVTSVVLNARTNYKYVADTSSGAVSKESAYLNGSQEQSFLAYNIYTWKVSDGKVKDKSGAVEVTVPKGVLYNSYNNNQTIYLKDAYPEYTGNASDYAYGNNKNELNNNKDKAYMANKNEWSDWCVGYVFSDEACTNKIAIVDYTAVTEDNLIITLFTDDDYASSIYYNGKLSAGYADIALEKADFVKSGKKGAVDFTKVAGIKISTNLSTGTLYVKSITF